MLILKCSDHCIYLSLLNKLYYGGFFFFFTFYCDGVWYEDGIADTVDPWENNDHITLIA